MSALDLATLALQGATLLGLTALLLVHQTRRAPPRPPPYVDAPVSGSGKVGVSGWGAVVVEGLPELAAGQGTAIVRVVAPQVQVYDVWALSPAGWVQLVPDGATWSSPLLRDLPVRSLRLWLARPGAGPSATRPAREASPMLVAAAHALAPRVQDRTTSPERGAPDPSALPGLLSTRGSSDADAHRDAAAGWARDVLIGGLLDGWTDAVVSASRVGWSPGLPTGDTLLEGWSRASAPSADPSGSFGRWLVGELGKATRAGLDRVALERREAACRLLFVAAARLLRGIDPDLELEASPPGGVGPRNRESWLVDEDLARALDNPPVHGLVQPILVLRPLLKRRGSVLVEGEVV